jgi:hypothetical protein
MGEPNLPLPDATGIITKKAFIAVPAAGLTCSIPISNSIQELVGQVFPNQLPLKTSFKKKIVVSSVFALRLSAPAVMLIWGMFSQMDQSPLA